MTEENNPEIQDFSEPVDTIQETLENFTDAANVKAVYGDPIRKGDLIIIPSAEIISAMGVGSASGRSNDKEGQPAFGKGFWGGGRILSRPVAVITAGPDGVKVDPIFDISKIYLTALTAFGFMLATLAKFRKGR